MATNASFDPPSDPPCPYPTYMTHAEAVALRDAGQLDPRCQIVITDGPVIGTPGNTSPTQIELNPVGPGDIGRTARVHTDFDNVAFSSRSYNIDAGPNGTLNQLTDHWNNNLTDEDDGTATSHTVHNQFPFHLSGANVRDNEIDDCDLTGLAAAITATGMEFRDNRLQESSLDFTGVTGGAGPASFFRRNAVIGSTVTLNVPIIYINNNVINDATVSHLGTGAGSFSFQDNDMHSSSVEVDASTTSQITVNNNVMGGTSGGYRVTFTGKTTGVVIVSGNRLYAQSGGSYEFQGSGTGQITMTSCEVGAGAITLSGPGNATLNGCTFQSATVTHGGPGIFQMTRAKLDNATVSHLGGGQVAVTDTAMNSSARLLVLAGQTGVVSLSACTLQRLYTMQFEATSTVTATINGSHFSGHTTNPSGVDMQVDGSGSRTVANSRIVADVTTTALVLLGSGTVSITQGSDLPGGRVLRDPATTAPLTITRSRIPGTVEQAAGATGGGLTIDTCDGAVVGTTVTQRGPGFMLFNSCRLGAGVRNSATATRGLSMAACDLQGGSFDQNRTGGTGTDICDGVSMRGSLSTIELNGAVDPGGNQTPLNTVAVESGSTLVLNDPAGTGVNSIVMQRSSLSGGTQVSGTGTQLVDGCRFSAGAIIDLGAFSHSFTVVEGQFTKTATANNVGRLVNASFDNWV